MSAGLESAEGVCVCVCLLVWRVLKVCVCLLVWGVLKVCVYVCWSGEC